MIGDRSHVFGTEASLELIGDFLAKKKRAQALARTKARAPSERANHPQRPFSAQRSQMAACAAIDASTAAPYAYKHAEKNWKGNAVRA